MDITEGPATTLSGLRNLHPADSPIAGNDAAQESLTLDVFDIDLLRQAVADSGLEHRQVGPGPFRGQLKRLRLEGLCVDSGRYSRTLQSRGCFASGAVVIGCILSESEAGCINAHRFGRNDLVVFPEGEEMDYLLPAHTHWVAIQAPRAVLLDGGIAPEALSRVTVYSATRPVNAMAAELLRRLLAAEFWGGSTWQAGDLGSKSAVNEVLDCLIPALNPEYARSHTRRPSLHKRAELVRRFERALYDCGPRMRRMPDLAANLEVSQRTLEQVFHEHLGISPKRYAGMIKLNQIYCELLRESAESTTVTEVAQGHGIRQLGRFSAEYRKQFGELPSETLRRPH